jgi:hypothetical protein
MIMKKYDVKNEPPGYFAGMHWFTWLAIFAFNFFLCWVVLQ